MKISFLVFFPFAQKAWKILMCCLSNMNIPVLEDKLYQSPFAL
jgi:hypothetical protein